MCSGRPAGRTHDCAEPAFTLDDAITVQAALGQKAKMLFDARDPRCSHRRRALHARFVERSIGMSASHVNGKVAAADDVSLQGFDEEQVRLMEERCIVLDHDDNVLRDGTKKECTYHASTAQNG